jgi:superfamily II DNA helicase RecQ
VARRDGKPSECIMYYCYGDKIKMEQMMSGDLHGDRSFRIRYNAKIICHCGFRRRFERGAITPQSFQLHKDNLLRMVSYCENTHECRCATPHSHLAASLHRPLPGARCSCLISAKPRSTVRSARVRGNRRASSSTAPHLPLICTSRIPLIQRVHRHVRQLQKRGSSRAAGLHAACAGVNAADGGCQQVRVHRLL